MIHRASRSRVAAGAIACLLAMSAASPAAASPDTFKRAFTNIIFGPVDFALSPVVASRACGRFRPGTDPTALT